MRTFVCKYMNFDIYVWSTGKHEAYQNGVPAGFAGFTLDSVLDKIARHYHVK